MKVETMMQYIDIIEQARIDKKLDATCYIMVLVNYELVKDFDPKDFALMIGRKESYKTEFGKALAAAKVMSEWNLGIQ